MEFEEALQILKGIVGDYDRTKIPGEEAYDVLVNYIKQKNMHKQFLNDKWRAYADALEIDVCTTQPTKGYALNIINSFLKDLNETHLTGGFVETKDTSWVKPGMSVRIGEFVQSANPNSTLKFSKNSGATGSVMSVDKDYATLYISTNITQGKPPQEKVPIVQCHKI